MAEKLITQIESNAQPILAELGYELADLELAKEGANWYLRFFIDKEGREGSVDLEDCRRASEALSPWLDEADPIPHAYFLEVSSPGIERVLKKDKDFAAFAGRWIQVSLYSPIDGQKIYIGTLGPVTADCLSLTVEEKELSIAREKIAKVQLYWKGEDDDEEE